MTVTSDIDDGQAANPLDDQDQDKIINCIRQDARKDMERISKVLSAICYGTALASVVPMTLSHRDRADQESNIQSFFYPIYTVMIHCIAAYISKRNHKVRLDDTIMKKSTWIATNATIIGSIGALLPVVYLYTSSITDAALWSPAFSSLLTMSVVIIFKLDFYWSSVALQDLQNSKYKYKSL